MRKTFLPDVNFWVALVFDHHSHHATALGRL
jgi:predicted nucleic acid-binding protein